MLGNPHIYMYSPSGGAYILVSNPYEPLVNLRLQLHGRYHASSEILCRRFRIVKGVLRSFEPRRYTYMQTMAFGIHSCNLGNFHPYGGQFCLNLNTGPLTLHSSQPF